MWTRAALGHPLHIGLSFILLALACAKRLEEHECSGDGLGTSGKVELLPGDHNEHEFRCIESGKCISRSGWCDGLSDCQDSSDETSCAMSNDRPKVRQVFSKQNAKEVDDFEEAEMDAEMAQEQFEEQEKARKKKQAEKKKESERAELIEAGRIAIRQAEKENVTCRNAAQGTDCFNHVLFAMNHGIFENPYFYPGLSKHSQFSEFQALLHTLPRNACPRPCTSKDEGCLRIASQNECVLRIQWVRQVELLQHKDWYPELDEESSDSEIAHSLWQRGVSTCYRPCSHHEADDPTLLASVLPHSMPPALTAPPKISAPTLLNLTMPPIVTLPPMTMPPTVTVTVTLAVTTTPAPTVTTTASHTATSSTPTTYTSTTVSSVSSSAAPEAAGWQPVVPTETITTVVETATFTSTTHWTTSAPPTATGTTTASSTSETTTLAPTSSLTTSVVHLLPEKPVLSRPERCREKDVSYLPIDMAGHLPLSVNSAAECQDHCAELVGAAYYSFYVPTLTCHCEAAEVAIRQESTFGYISGVTSCAEIQQNPETSQILKRIDDGCYEVGFHYSPAILPASTYQATSFQCQQHCQKFGERCSYFVFFSLDRTCHLVGPDGVKAQMAGSVSGPRSCQGSEMPYPQRLFLAKSAVDPVSGDFLQALFASAMAMVAFGALGVAWRRHHSRVSSSAALLPSAALE